MTINLAVLFAILFVFPAANGLGSMSTLAISYGSPAVCGILAGKFPQSIECFQGSSKNPVNLNVSFDGISGGNDFFCGLRYGGLRLYCWNSGNSNSSFLPKRIYNGTARLRNLCVGEDQVCAIEDETRIVRCWRGRSGGNVSVSGEFLTITAGTGFTCGVLAAGTVRCWGSAIGLEIQSQFRNTTMSTLIAGDSHVCGISVTGILICRGSNDTGQLSVPSPGQAFEFSGLALGVNRSCAIRSSDGSVVCWGGGFSGSDFPNMTSFVSIVAGGGYFCGLMTRNLSVTCWGQGPFNAATVLPLPKLIPGSCTQIPCSCETYPDSQNLCSGSRFICKPCGNVISSFLSPSPQAGAPQAPPPTSAGKTTNKGLLAFAIVGSVGSFSGICTVIYCIWTRICPCRQKKIHNSVQPTITTTATTSPLSRCATIRRQSSRPMKRQRSGTSSKHADRAEEFSFVELTAATGNFSPENQIGAGSFGTVYKGKLSDGREVAIKRGETGPRTKKFQEKESAFQSELSFLSRLHHKHLVSLVGFCEEQEERLLVYDFMHNGAVYDHLHTQKNRISSPLHTWKMRIKIALEASRGLEYLHNYAVPPIIHRDIKSSNILLDSNWTARVSDFGLSLILPESDDGHLALTAAGTVGYMDPEYYGVRHLTFKSDVYGLGVVLLELLTGKRAIYKDEESGPTSVVDYAVPKILADELPALLDSRVAPPKLNDIEAVELMAYTAVHCVNLEGKDRPTMTDVVANLERALALCGNSHGSISSAGLSLASE